MLLEYQQGDTIRRHDRKLVSYDADAGSLGGLGREPGQGWAGQERSSGLIKPPAHSQPFSYSLPHFKLCSGHNINKSLAPPTKPFFIPLHRSLVDYY